MFSFANMLHLFTHKFPGLSRRGFPLPFIFAGPFDDIFFWHNAIAFAPRSTVGCVEFAAEVSHGAFVNQRRYP